MSHFAKLLVKFTDAEALKAALVNLGIAPDAVQCTKEPQSIRDYRGENTRNKAHVRVPREKLASSTADMGWLLGEKSEAWLDEYNNPVISRNGGLDKFNNRVKQEYAACRIEQHARRQGKQPRRELCSDGHVKVYVGA